MQVGTIALLVVLVLTGAFAALNWPAFTAPVSLSLGMTTLDAPLGLILLGVVALVALLFVVSMLAMQGRALAEHRRQAKALQAQRDLADQAEASRFTDLRNHINAELRRVAQASDSARDGVLARLDRMEQQMRLQIDQTGNTLSAYIGQLEDRFERRALSEPPQELPARRT